MCRALRLHSGPCGMYQTYRQFSSMLHCVSCAEYGFRENTSMTGMGAVGGCGVVEQIPCPLLFVVILLDCFFF